MNLHRSKRAYQALTIFELIIVVAVLVLLAGIILPALAKSRMRACRINCVNNLKQVGLAFRIWPDDNYGLLPMQVPLNSGGAMEPAALGDAAAIFQVMSNELSTPKVLICSDDFQHRFATNFTSLSGVNLSYFVGLEANTNFLGSVILSGDANLTLDGKSVRSGLLALAPNAGIKWDESRGDRHRYYGNLVFADGHVAQLANFEITNSLMAAGFATNHLAIP